MKRRNLDDSGGRGAGVSAVFAKDTLRCWLRSWKRFVSIAVITLLGVAVLTGIYAGCRDAFLAAGRFYDQQGLHDLQVLSTYGLTGDDAAALRRIDGVQTVQPERSQTVTTLVDGTKKTVTMQEIGTEGLDQPYIRQGKLPNKAGEVAVTQQFLNDSGLKIGGTITVTPQDTSSSVISVAATETDDSNNADTVGVAANASASDAKSDANTDADAEQSPQFPTKLTITGVVLDPRDLNNPDGYSGMTSFRSTSSEDYTFFASSDGVTGNIYTAISVAVTGASDFDTFSDAYDEAIKTVADRIEHQIQATRQKARRQQIVSSAQRKLDDAKDEANEQLDEAQKQIDDNWAELEANKTTLQDSRTELENNRTTITDGERQLADGRAQIASARQQIAQGRQQIAEARTQLESGKAQLTSARKQLDAAQTELTANRTKIEQGITQIDQGVAQIDQMLSSDYETRVHVNKKELLDCIDRATLLIKEGDKKPIIIDIKNESMELKIKSQIGSMDELIFCTKDGKDLMIGFNPKFLIDALRVIEDEEVDLYFMNAKAPCFIKDENQSYIYLILPVNFNASV